MCRCSRVDGLPVLFDRRYRQIEQRRQLLISGKPERGEQQPLFTPAESEPRLAMPEELADPRRRAAFFKFARDPDDMWAGDEGFRVRRNTLAVLHFGGIPPETPSAEGPAKTVDALELRRDQLFPAISTVDVDEHRH